MFNRSHYQIIAKAISSSTSIHIQAGTATIPLLERNKLIDLLCFYFRLDNPRFDEVKFRLSCDEVVDVK